VLWPRLPSDHRGGGRGHFCSGCRVPFASVNGAAIHYGLGPPRTPARGPSVVFVHGAGGAQGQVVHRREKELTENVVAHWHAFPEGVRDILFIPIHLERIGDNVENLLRCIDMIRREGIPFTDRAVNEISTLFERSLELLECVRDLIPTRNRILMRYVVKGGEEFQTLASEYAQAHQERLIQGLCLPKASSSFLALLDYPREIEWHTRQIVQKMTAHGGPV